jgi:hypothetical protein
MEFLIMSKKIILALIAAAALAFGITACQPSDGGDEAANGADNGAAADANGSNDADAADDADSDDASADDAE